ncbi:MAG: hypothetical protein AABW49_00435 [Nanoarchaeota archaeon]
MQRIILDTNILLQDKVDVLREIEKICDFRYELFILEKTLEELENKKGSKFAFELVSRNSIKIIRTNKKISVDELLLEMAEKEKFIVATQDKNLKQRLIKKGITIITIRQKKYMIIVNKNVL